MNRVIPYGVLVALWLVFGATVDGQLAKTITGNGQTVCWGTTNFPSLTIQASGTWVGTLEPRASQTLAATPTAIGHAVNDATGSVAASINSNVRLAVQNYGYRQVCMTSTAWTSGTVTLTALRGVSTSVDPTQLLTVSTTLAGTPASTTETDLWTYSLPANTLSVNGRSLRVTAWGTVAANANTKSIRFYFAGTSYSIIGASTFAGVGINWVFRAVIVRTGASAQQLLLEKEASNGNVDDWAFAVPAADTTAPIVIKVTGQNGTAAANDIVFRGAIVEIVQ